MRGRDSPRRFLPPGRGRGSSVGSIVCYLTGLSHVDPVANELSLGRFLNHELASVPDIDLDFPRDIREKLIVAVTERYGNEHAALVASFATYRSRGAIRDVGKALGLPQAELERLARLTDGWDASRIAEEVAGLPDAERKLVSKRWRAFQFLTAEIAGLPRHISQHPGGMVISSRPLIDLVPVQPAAMAGRQLCQWDKDSCADAGFLKIDLLGLGMLSAVEDCVEKIAEIYGAPIDLSRIPLDDRGRVRGDPAGGHGRHLPDREPGPDAEPAAHEAGDDRRPHGAGRARAAGPDPGQGGAPLHRAPPAAARGSDVRLPGRSRGAAGAAPLDARRRRLPGSGARRGDRARGLHGGRGGGPASRDEPQAQPCCARVPSACGSSRVPFATASTRRSRISSTTSSSVSPASASRSRMRPRSGCSPTSRSGCATTIRPSSSARC